MPADEGWLQALTLCVIGHLHLNGLWSVLKWDHTEECFVDIGGAGVSAGDSLFVATAVTSEDGDARWLEEHVWCRA